MQKKQRALVVCPGRGTYNKPDLGYLHRYHASKQQMIETIDMPRQLRQQPSIVELDQASRYQLATHTAGENASSLIFACATGDFMDIDRERFEVVAVTGNSMGWYITLAMAEALTLQDSARLINTMGSMMQSGIIGGQLIYPVVDEHWQPSAALKDTVQHAVREVNQQPECELYLSIDLGGYWVLAGNQPALSAVEALLPKVDDTFPMRLFNHAAFHTPLLQGISAQGKQQLPDTMFRAPAIPMIDGEGHIWQPHSTHGGQLWEYTLGKQVTDTYHFNRAIEVGLKEFAPDVIIVLGPGTSLSGSVGQCLVQHGWDDVCDKHSFVERQQQNPLVYAMAIPEQRSAVTRVPSSTQQSA